jgi:hypothetical protein
MQLSGTSFAAPVVSGAAAQVLARHPDWTPDQVKGALMKTARPMPGAPAGSAGLGQVTPYLAVSLTSAPDGNAPLSRFVTSVSGGSGKAWDTASWETTIQSNASWDTASWLDASWLDASWLDASWESASWLDASWLDASWLDASWNDASWEDAAEGDATDPNQLAFDDADRSAALSSDLGITPDLLPPVDATTTTTATTTTATTTVAGALG